MKFKRALAMLLAAIMLVALVACNGGGNQDGAGTTITLWTYPIGKWGDEATVNGLVEGFKAETGITVKVEYLTYTDGDNTVNSAITGKNTPDLIMEGPERLVANWGANGHLVDLAGMLDATDKAEIDAVNPGILAACTTSDGKVYEYPLVMTAHCMAINKPAFEAAGALQYLDLNTRTWTTDNFIKAMNAMYDYYKTDVGAVFCNEQGGDQGTRALVNNLYGGTFTNAEHTAYTWTDPENIQALQLLAGMDAIKVRADLNGGAEIKEFYNGTLKMAFCWNIAQQLDPNTAGTGEGKTIDGEEIVFMSFPSPTGKSELQGGIWGFGIFDNGDQARIDAAKQFITYMCDSAHTVDAVKAANYFPVRTTAGGTDLTNMWADNQTMGDYNILMQYLGDYYQVTTNWTQARYEWWNMLQEVGAGQDITSSVTTHCNNANG